MGRGGRNDDWMRDVAERQRNLVFPDTARNLGGFWRGVRNQKLNLAQSVGLLILIVFYVVLLIGLVAQNWSTGPASAWQKVFYGYGPYLLLSAPLILFFLLLHWRMRHTK
jgi:hypothetical protein